MLILRPIRGSPQANTILRWRCWVGWPSATYRQMRHRLSRKFCLSHLACGGRQPQLFGYDWSMALGLPQAEKTRLVTERYRVRCATHAPSAVTWPADDRRRQRRRRRDHTRVIITIIVAAANANDLKSGVFLGFVVYRENRLESCDVIAPCAFRRAHWLGPCGPWRVYGPPVSSHTYRSNL